MARYALRWFYAAVAATLILGVAYAVLQQQYRQSLNDPQIQMAEDIAFGIEHGGGIENLILSEGRPLQTATSTQGHIDIAQSLSPWVAYYDNSGNPLESTGLLGGQLPTLPKGVFDPSSWIKHQNGTFYNQSPIAETRFTWQPQSGVRQAVVLVKLADNSRGISYVASGRNMREGEQRIEHLGEMVFVGWLATLLVLAVLQLFYVFVGRAARGSAGGSR
jgi:hypothetical protein